MRFSEILHLVWMNITENKTKVLLTSLGVIVGAATIVLVIAIGHGGEVDVQEQFKTLNVGAIQVSVSTSADMADAIAGGMPAGMPGEAAGGNNTTRQQGGFSSGGFPGGGTSLAQAGGRAATAQKGVTLTTTDVDDITSLVPDVTSASIITSGTGAVLTDDLDAETDETIVGCLPEYQSISNLELLTGDFITQDDQDGKSKVAVVGYNLAKTLFWRCLCRRRWRNDY